MLSKDYGRMKKLVEKMNTEPDSVTAEEARDLILLMKKSNVDDALKVAEKVLIANACEKKTVYTSDDGSTVTIGEPVKMEVNIPEFMRDRPAEYKRIMDRKIENLTVAVTDLSKDDQKLYVHYVKAKPKVTVKLA